MIGINSNPSANDSSAHDMTSFVVGAVSAQSCSRYKKGGSKAKPHVYSCTVFLFLIRFLSWHAQRRLRTSFCHHFCISVSRDQRLSHQQKRKGKKTLQGDGARSRARSRRLCDRVVCRPPGRGEIDGVVGTGDFDGATVIVPEIRGHETATRSRK